MERYTLLLALRIKTNFQFIHAYNYARARHKRKANNLNELLRSENLILFRERVTHVINLFNF